MPLTVTSSKAVVGLSIESTAGESVLLAATTALATNVGISAPPGSSGGRVHVIINAWTLTGTFTITGVGTPNNSEGPITVAAPTTQQTQSQTGYSFEYVSTNA